MASGGNYGATWEKASVDPSAGVRLYPRLVKCIRCGVVKGRPKSVRPGLCRDCRAGMPMSERAAWAA